MKNSNTQFSRVITHIAKSWKFHSQLQIATVIVLVSCFTVVSSVFLVSGNLQKILTLWGESMQVSVYLKEDLSLENITAIEKYLTENKNVEKTKYVNKKDALKLFQEQMASYAPDILSDKDLIKYIPSSFQFGISKNVDIQDQLSTMQNLATSLRVMSGVEEVNYGQDWAKNYSSVFQTLSWLSHFFIIIVVSAASFVIANSIQTSIHQRKEEIEVMELIGATSKYIRFPFLWEGALLGFLASSFSLLLCYGIFLAVKDFFQKQIAFLQLSTHIQFIEPFAAFSLISFGLFIGIVTSWFCVRNINNGWAAIQVQKQ